MDDRGLGAPRVGRGVWIGVLLWLSGAALIVLQPDKDTATLVLMLGFGVAFLGGLRSQWVLLSMLAGGVFAGALIATPLLLGALRSQPWETQPGAYVVKRIQATLNPWAHEREVGYQMVRADCGGQRWAVRRGHRRGAREAQLARGRERLYLRRNR